MVKTWYKVIYDGGWFKEDTLESVIATATENELYSGKVKRVIQVTERDCSLEELMEGKQDEKYSACEDIYPAVEFRDDGENRADIFNILSIDGDAEFYLASEADKELRKALHALWMARVRNAKNLVIAFENYDYLDFGKLTIKQESAKTWMTCKLRTPAEWVKIWKDVQAKCLKKAKEYK